MNFDWRSWKLQNQVIWIFLLQSLLLFITLLSIDAYSYSLITEIFKENSKALMMRENNSSTTFTQYLTVKNISLIIDQSSRAIVNANDLFQFSIGLDYQFIQQPLDCLTYAKSVDQYSFSSSVCYGSYGVKEQTKQDQQFLNYTGLMTSLLPLYLNFTFYYAQTKENYYFAQNPGQDLTNVNFHLRPWYTTYLQSNDNSLTKFCTPYLSSVGGYLIAQSTGLKYKNGTNFAIFGHPLRILSTIQTIQQNMNISIVDKNGLIYSVGNQNDAQIYLKDESFTGFNLSQQTDILDTLDRDSIMLYNSLLEQNVTINARSLANTGLILIFQSNPLFQEDLINQHLIQTSEQIFSIYQKFIIIWTFVTLFCILVSIIILIIILKPITDVTKIMNKAIMPLTSQQVLNLYLQNKNRSQLCSFENAFHKMTTSISQSNLQISSQCTFMNKARCYASASEAEYLWSPIIPYFQSICSSTRPASRSNELPKHIFFYELFRLIKQIQ